MKGRLSLATIALATAFTLLWLSTGAVQACSFGEGHQHFDYDLEEQEFAVREGYLKSGDQVAIKASGGAMDLFVFDEQQYYGYVIIGKDTPGWNGAALFNSLGVAKPSTIFTAPEDGTYFIVVDNTVAGHDAGVVQKSISLDTTFPFGQVENEPAPYYPEAIIAGFVLFTLAVLVVFSRKGK